MIAYRKLEIYTCKWNGRCKGGQQFNSSMCNSKLIGARYFNAALKREAGLSSGFLPIVESARDTTGHGTLISSIVIEWIMLYPGTVFWVFNLF